MKELHSMGMMSCCSDLMFEVAHQLAVAFGRGSKIIIMICLHMVENKVILIFIEQTVKLFNCISR